jgi:hypothetical protein
MDDGRSQRPATISLGSGPSGAGGREEGADMSGVGRKCVAWAWCGVMRLRVFP